MSDEMLVAVLRAHTLKLSLFKERWADLVPVHGNTNCNARPFFRLGRAINV